MKIRWKKCCSKSMMNQVSTELPDNTTTETITPQVPGYYKCGHCALHFKTRARFRTHEATCLSLKQIRARATFAPAPSSESSVSIQDLFSLVQDLAVRLETTEHELSVLKRQQREQLKRQHNAENKVHRDNLLQWLKTRRCCQVFSEWLPAIPPITREQLELVFQHGFIDGMCSIIASIVATSPVPVCAYEEAPDTLFVYERQDQEQNSCWRAMTRPEFEKFINRMQKLLMNEFVSWQQENKERWHDPDFAEKYDANLLKVTGSGKAKSGGCSNRDMLMTRMKPKVCAAIKQSANAEVASVSS